MKLFLVFISLGFYQVHGKYTDCLPDFRFTELWFLEMVDPNLTNLTEAIWADLDFKYYHLMFCKMIYPEDSDFCFGHMFTEVELPNFWRGLRVVELNSEEIESKFCLLQNNYFQLQPKSTVHVLLSWFYPDYSKTNFIKILCRFCPNFLKKSG